MSQDDEHNSDPEMLIDDIILASLGPPPPPPRAEKFRNCLHDCCHDIICRGKTAKQLYATIYIILSIIPIITTILHTILTQQSVCDEPNGESTGLLILTLTIFIFTLFLIFKSNGNYKNLRSPIPAVITFILYIIQFVLTIHIFHSYPSICNDSVIVHITYYLLLSCIMISSIILLTFIIVVSCKINSEANGYGRNAEVLVLIAAVVCQFGVVLVPSTLQMILINIAKCGNDEDVSILETVLLPIMTLVGCVFGIIVIYTKDSILFGIVCLILFSVIPLYCILV